MSEHPDHHVAVLIERSQTFERHCRDQHRDLDKKLTDIYHTLFGNGREGILERMKGHTQEIAAIRSNLDGVRKEIHEVKGIVQTTNDVLGGKVTALDTRFWKMAIFVCVGTGGVVKGVDVLVKMIAGG